MAADHQPPPAAPASVAVTPVAAPGAAESERLAELHALRLLDASAKNRFLNLSQLASDLFDVPIASVTLIDRNRQWFTSAVGLSADYTSRDIAFCNHAIERDGVMVVEDASKDARFLENPLVTGAPFIRFYAGATLRGPKGHALGTFCIIDQTPRVFSERDRARLAKLAKVVEWEIAQDNLISRLLQDAEARSLFDAVTGLPNRHHLRHRLDTQIAIHPEMPVWVGFLDINDFEGLRRVAGKIAAESVLREVADRLKAIRPALEVGHWREDQFVFFVPLAAAEASVDAVLTALRQCFEAQFRQSGLAYDINARLGLSAYPDDGSSARVLVRKARSSLPPPGPAPDGLNISHYSPDVSLRQARQFEIGQRMRSALADGALDVFYQPIISIETGEMVCAEALLRWTDPVLGRISPTEFVPIAETSKLIQELGEYVFDQVYRDMAAWQSARAALVPISVNVSGQQLGKADFPQNLLASLTARQIPSHLLQLELTEHTLVTNLERAADSIVHAAEAGVICAVDDFGTGYASFNYLRRLPLRKLKIDREYIEAIDGDPRDQEIVRAIIAMAHALGLKVTAEGVERQSQWDLLREMQCDHVQGLLTGAAMTAADIARKLGA